MGLAPSELCQFDGWESIELQGGAGPGALGFKVVAATAIASGFAWPLSCFLLTTRYMGFLCYLARVVDGICSSK
jgi:hypothetical protein